jgi:hypothetical protein
VANTHMRCGAVRCGALIVLSMAEQPGMLFSGVACFLCPRVRPVRFVHRGSGICACCIVQHT